MSNIGVMELIILALICLPVLAVAAIIFLVYRNKQQRDQEQQLNMKKCPYCAEFIKREALVCRYCGRDQPQES